MKLEVFRLMQWGYGEKVQPIDLYITVVTMKQIKGRLDYDRWSPKNREGYQRPTQESRFKSGKYSIVRYILRQLGVFPTSVLLNIRETISFHEEENNGHTSIGLLEIPDDVKFYVCDGQHRLEALNRAITEVPDLINYPIPVTITNLSKFEEMLIFYIVNSRAKSIPTDLVYKHLQTMLTKKITEPKYAWLEDLLGLPEQRKAIAASIVDFLSENIRSPFKDRIHFVNTPPSPYYVVKDIVLARYIEKILRDETLYAMDIELLAEYLVKYWTAIKELWYACFKEPREYTLLTTNTGIAVMTYLFPSIYGLCARDADLTKDCMKKYLSYLTESVDISDLDESFRISIDEKWWSRAHGSSWNRALGEKNFAFIRDNFKKKIFYLARMNREA